VNAAQKMDQITNKASPTPLLLLRDSKPADSKANSNNYEHRTEKHRHNRYNKQDRAPQAAAATTAILLRRHEGIVKPLGADGGQPVAIVGPLAETVTAHVLQSKGPPARWIR